MGQVTSNLSRKDTRDPSDIQFRVLIIGRANAGKTSILQRVCDTTDSPKIYRRNRWGRRKRVQLDPTIERGMHNIEDELIFTNHTGYLFHDSRGFESGSQDELKIVQEFVRHKSREHELKDRLHAIWYCIPMDNARPELDLKYFDDICPDKNVPVIAVFTKYDQFRRNIGLKLEDQRHDPALLDAEVENMFNEHYLDSFTEPPPFVRLERMHKPGQQCNGLIEMTADVLSGGVVALMLVAVQKDQNLELSIKHAIGKARSAVKRDRASTEEVIKLCIRAFPSLWIESEYWSGGREQKLLHTNEENQLESVGKYSWETDPELQTIFSTLKSFVTNSNPSISTDDQQHIMIVTILILEHACLLYASPSRPSLNRALDNSISRYSASDTHSALMSQFPAPQEYSASQFTEFILEYRLGY